MRTSKLTVAAGLGLALAVASGAQARKRSPHPQSNVQQGMRGSAPPASFAVTRALPVRSRATQAPHPGAWGQALVSHQGHLFVLDAQAGELVMTASDGAVLGRLAVGSRPTQMVLDPARGRLWVAVRGDNQVLAVEISSADAVANGAARLRRVDSFVVPDPHGLALSPDGNSLAVTSPAEGRVALWRVDTAQRQWSRKVGPEPRGVAIDPSGQHLSVAFLTMGSVASIELADPKASVHYRSLEAPTGAQAVGAFGLGGLSGLSNAPAQQQSSTQQFGSGTTLHNGAGKSFARNAFAIGYLGPALLALPHQVSTPVAANLVFEDRGSYGGGGAASPAVRHGLSMIDAEDDLVGHAQFALHQPRAMAYDAAADRLYVVGYGNDRLLAVDEVTQSTAHLGYEISLNVGSTQALKACGPDAVVLTDAGPVVHCELDQGLRFVSEGETPTVQSAVTALSSTGPNAAVARGAEIFRRGNDPRLSAGGTLACASCHPEGLSDGLSWRIEGRALQTPLLRGRVMGSHPYKWDGKDKDLPTSLRNTVRRLGGGGLSADDSKDLQAYLGSLPAPRAPLARRPDAVKRGAALFASAELNCDACHGGEGLSDGEMHTLESDLSEADTPSLVGLARSAPYYHDGSAPTLRALLMDNGGVHGMVDAAKLSPGDSGDLVAYLESL